MKYIYSITKDMEFTMHFANLPSLQCVSIFMVKRFMSRKVVKIFGKKKSKKKKKTKKKKNLTTF